MIRNTDVLSILASFMAVHSRQIIQYLSFLNCKISEPGGSRNSGVFI